MKLGQLNRLVVKKSVEFGVYLDGREWGEILLPKRYVPATADIGSSLEVFLYLDSEDQLIATTESPKVMVGQVALLEVVAVTRVGAFLNWGLKKDLLVPFAEQQVPLQVGHKVMVYCYVDRSNRIVASTKLDKFLGKSSAQYQAGEAVSIVVTDITDLGYKVVVDQQHIGLLYKNEVFKPLRRGWRDTAYVNKVREDGRIDLRLQKSSHQTASSLTEQILARLAANNGSLALSDKTSPELIYQAFGVSKKVFKQALGALLKQDKIVIAPDHIRLK